MVIFEYTEVVISDGDLIFLFNEVWVGEARVANIMAGSSDDIAHHIPVVQIALLLELTTGCDVIEGLGQVCAMRLIVVGYGVV